ncbi:serine-rich adhesin for platelets-like [Cataglyphis hispanica]|uniref:serine-rich adhesin for platelets-like n=1 Tax=Cataglyphis hispanica TaxID=1086592 RepID=UPI00218010AF|nr:serine-rich adhesin for platelets-like [Cataglyphis hispanica]
MATNCVVDGDYLGAYLHFFAEFVARVNPNDQLPVKVSAYDIDESELVGEVISVSLQYLNKIYCPPSLQSYIVHLVIEAIKSTCKKQPEICGLRPQEKTYAPLKLMQAVTNEINEICMRYLDNSRLALLPPPSSTFHVTVGATRNARRKMEDRHMILHDLHTIFNIRDNTIVNYYAVFDGHGGQDAAAYCATHLHQYLVESVYYPTDPESALRDAFLTTDARFIAKSSTQKLNGGTTAVCALLLNKKLYIAWVGDSMASLVTSSTVKPLVNPHRPAREDERERIRNMGGVVVYCMGVLRVNGFLSISRAIGDVPYKPYVSGEPEVRCVSLDGTEDFLIIACDGLWDYVDQRTAALRVYRQVLQNPHDLKHVHQALLQSAKRAGSLDNITVIVVFLTSPVEIASRHSLLNYQLLNGATPNLLLNNMDPNNPMSSNSGQFDVNAAFIKQQQQQSTDEIENLLLHCDLNRGMTRNGKHQDGDGNDDDDDYGDLGPETDVDAGEDAIDGNPSVEPLIISSSSYEFVSDKSSMETEVDNEGNNKEKEEDLLNRDNANICPSPVDSVKNNVSDDRDILSDKDVLCDERPRSNNDGDNDDNEARVESTTGTHTLVDDDKSPPSPRDAKTLHHALISEPKNIEESEEESEEEWDSNDSNKEKYLSIFRIHKPGHSDKCEGLKGNNCSSSNDDISLDEYCDGNMAFQLNPEAVEFVPLSPPLINKLQDYALSGSPLRKTSMDNIYVPTQAEFEAEINQRPKEIGQNFVCDDLHGSCESNLPDTNMSEISTKAEVDDESMARIVSTTQWQMGNSSQWSATTHNDAESDSEEYEIVNMDNPMTISFTPGDFEVAFEKGVDLNAVHDLNDSSDDAEHINTPPRSPGGLCVNESARADTPLDDKAPIDVLCISSTPHPADNQSTRTATSEWDEAKVLSVEADGFTPLPYDLCRKSSIPSSINNLTDKSQCMSIESKFTNSDKFKSASSVEEDISKEMSLKTNENLVDNQQPIDSSKENYNETFELLTTEPEIVKLTDKFDKIQNEGEQTSLYEKDDKTQSKPLDETMKVKSIECVPSEIVETINEEQLTTEKMNKKDITDNSETKCNEPSSESVLESERSDTEIKHLELSDKEMEYQRAEQRRLAQPNIDTDIEFCLESSHEFKPSNWTDFYKTGSKSMLLEEDEPYQCNKSYELATGHQQSSETPEKDNKNDKNDKNDKSDDDAKPANADPSDLEKDSTEKPMQPESQTHEQNAELPCTSNAQTEQELIEIEAASANVDEISEKQIASEDISMNKQEEIKSYLDLCEETTETLPDDTMTMKTETEITSTSSSNAVSTTTAQETTISSSVQPDLAQEFVATHPKQLVDEEKLQGQPNIDTDIEFCLESSHEFKPSNWTDFYKTGSKSMLLEEDEPYQCNKSYELATGHQQSSETPEKDNKNVKNDKNDKSDDDVKPASADPSDLEKDSTEKPMQPESQTHEQNVQLPSTLNSAQTEQELIEIETASANIDEISEKQIASEDSFTKEETKRQETAKALLDLTKVIDFNTYTNAATEAAAATTTTVSTKAKATTTSTKRSTKTTTTTSTTKTATKITPASPSKAVSTTTARITATSPPGQPALAKKSVAARPKQLVDGSTKAAAISSVGSKVTGTKTTTSSKNVTTTTKTSLSPRVSTTKSRTSTASTASSKSSTLSAEKKSATNLGETKPVGKVTATTSKPTSTKTTTTKITPVKSMSSTTTTTSNVTLKPRSTSVGTTVKTSVTMSKQSVTISSSRPKTASPTSSSVNKLRENSAKTTTTKSPLIDKQSKESANKEISHSSATGTLSSSKTGNKPSAPLGTTTAAKRSSVGKSPGKSSGNTISPIKKSTLTLKGASRTTSSSTGTRSTLLSESQKVLQNGISEKRMEDVTQVAITTATSDKPEDDVLRKDASPVNVLTDNQLIITD